MGDIVDFRSLTLVQQGVAFTDLDVDSCVAANELPIESLVVDEPWTPGLLPPLADSRRLELRRMLDELSVLPVDPVDVMPSGSVRFTESDVARLAVVYERLGLVHSDGTDYPTWRQRHLAAQVIVAACLRTLLRQDGAGREIWNRYPPGLILYLQSVVDGDTAGARARWSGVEGRFVYLHLSAQHALKTQ